MNRQLLRIGPWMICLGLGLFLVLSDGRSQSSKETAGIDECTPVFLVLPYLQLPTTTAMTVMWETNHKLPSRVEFGLTRELGNAFGDSNLVVLHEVRLTGLDPGATYYYRVRSGELVSEIYKFKTAPPPGTKRWRMAVYGDSRSNPATHKKVVEQIARAGVDLIVHTGDIVLNGKNHNTWRTEFFEPLNPLGHSVPWVSTIGNHEQDSANYFSYMALPGNERFFGFDFANGHIICLDSNGWIEKGRDSKQYEWLTRHLREQRPATWTFVAFHHPLFSAHLNRPINALRWDWAPVFLDPENHVDGVLTGHDHFYAHNYRMGRLAAKPQPGVLFLTTAGGGASLYKTKPRDYIAREKAVHHFTLFDFDGERATVTAIDLTGKVVDRFQLTKEPTPPDEFCAYDIEELRQFLRLALAGSPTIQLEPKSGVRYASLSAANTIDTHLQVPTRFRVPVAGKLIWQDVPHWRQARTEIAFHLEPGQALDIPIHAQVEPGDFPKTPGVTIEFEPGRFHNRFIDLHPIKLSGPEVVAVERTKSAPLLDGRLDEDCWKSSGASRHSSFALLGSSPRGGREGRVQWLADKDWLYVAAKVNDPSGKLAVKKEVEETTTSRLVLSGDHVRLVVWDGQEVRSFALSPEQIRYATIGSREDKVTQWQGVAAQQHDGWSVEIAVPRTLLSDPEHLRVNFVHRRRDGKDLTDFELCPTYGIGTDPDQLPDWRPADAISRFARLQLP